MMKPRELGRQVLQDIRGFGFKQWFLVCLNVVLVQASLASCIHCRSSSAGTPAQPQSGVRDVPWTRLQTASCNLGSMVCMMIKPSFFPTVCRASPGGAPFRKISHGYRPPPRRILCMGVIG